MWIRLVSLFTSTLVMTILVGMLLKQVGLFFLRCLLVIKFAGLY